MLLLLLLGGNAVAQISGTVYRDFNANGTREYSPTSLTGEVGVGGVTVTVYAGGAVVGTATTSSVVATQGQFSIVPSAVGPYRIQFTNLPSGYFAGPRGSQSGTTVQFANTSPATVNLGINYPTDYCQTEPNFYVPCYVNGNPTSTTGNAGAQPVLVTLPYSTTSTGTTTAEVGIAVNSQIGTVYGVAYQRASRNIFSSAFVKRHSGLGPSGAGAIYITKPGSGTTYTSSLFATIPNVGTVATNTARGLTGTITDQNRDVSVFDQVGKTGLGDLEISDDGSQLYVLNLNDRQLYRVPITNANSANPTAGTPVAFTVPSPSQTTGSVFRPFALKYYRDRVYVGGVTTNEGVTATRTFSAAGSSVSSPNLITRDTVGMKAVVYEFNPATNAFTQVLSFPLTYKRGAVNNDKVGVDRSEYWLPWTNIQPGYDQNNPSNANPIPNRFSRADLANCSYPQPWFSGIEFDIDGSMIVSIRDRLGDQYGNLNLGLNPNSTQLFRPISPGDLLRAGQCSPGQWTIENNARICNGTPTAGANNGQGPGNGEYYFSDAVSVGETVNNVFRPYHLEMSVGGLAVLPGRDEVAATVMDPTTNIDAGGIRRFRNSNGTGSPSTSVQIYESSNVATFGKANGLGDLEIGCNYQPIEIGNRIFNDGSVQTANGVQDNGQGASNFANITVQLYQGGTLVGTTTSNANGEYYFTNLLPNTAYEIRVPLSQTALAGYTPTTANAGSDDNIDSDGVTVGNNVVISLTTGDYGENNHSYDFGFATCPTITNASASQTVCSGTPVSSLSVTTTATGTDAIRFVYFTSPQSGTAAYSGGTSLGTATPSGGTASISNVAFPANTGTTPVTYYVYAILNPTPGAVDCRPQDDILITVRPLPAGSATATAITCAAPATVTGTSSLTGSTFSWTGPGGFTSTAASFTTNTPGTYTLVVSASGCTDPTPATVVVNQNTTPPQNVTATNNGPLTCTNLSATVSATSSTTGITYRWVGPSGFTSTAQSFTTSISGTYSVTLTGPNGCTATTSTIVSSNTTAPSVTASVSNTLTCAQPTATVSASSTTGGVTYRWAGPGGFTSTAASFTTATAGTYSVTATNPVNGCSAITSVVVSQNTTLPANVGASNTGPLTCTLTTATVSASSTTGGVTYRWAGPGGFTSTAQSFTTATAGTYSVTVTAPNGCTVVTSTSVQQDLTAPTITASNTGPLTCTLNTVTVSATSDVAATYRWAGPGGFTSTAQSFTTATAGTYSVTVTSANGCTAVTNTNVQQDRTAPTITASNTGPLTCTLTTVTVSATSDVAATYRWAGPGGFTSTAQSFTTATAGTYSVTVTSANGCTAVTSTSVGQDVAAPTVTATNTGPLTCTLTSVNVSASASEAVTYRWTGPNNFSATTQSFTTSVPGTYTVVVTAANGCTATATSTINQNTTPPAGVVASNNGPLTCNLAAVGVSVTSSGGVAYRWVGPSGFTTTSQSFTTSVAGTYSVTVTAANGCTATASTSVTQDVVPPANVAATNNGPITCAQTTATVSASSTTGGVTYRWVGPGGFTSISQSFVTTVAGTYSVTLTAPNGCTATASTTVGQNITPPAGVAATNNGPITCAQPTATVSASSTTGGVTYRWAGPNSFSSTAQSFATSVAGVYSVTVTNPANGCTTTVTTTVTQDVTTPAGVAATNNGPITCAQPTATVSASSTTGGVTYRWAGPGGFTSTAQSFTTSVAGVYSVTVTSANGCTATANTTVGQDIVPPADVTVSNTGPLTCTLTAVNVSASSSTPGVTYRWAGPGGFTSISQSFVTTVAGTYSVTLTAPNGCTATASTTVGQNITPPAGVAATNNGPITCAQPTATVSASSTTGGVTYRWAGPNSFSSTAQSFATSVAGVYSVTVTNPANGCTTTVTTTVTQDVTTPAGVVATNNGPLSCTLTAVTVSASSTTGGVTYRWAGPGGFTSTAQSFTTSVAGVYSVTVTSANGCVATANTTVGQDVAPPTVIASNTGPLTCALTTRTVSATANEAMTYAWSGPGGFTSTAASFTTSVAGTYSVTVTSANGCTATASTTLQQDVVPPTVTAANNGPITCALTAATVNATANEAVTYAWSGPGGFTSTAASFTTSVAGTYSVTVTSANGCTATASTTLQQNVVAPTVAASNNGPLTCLITSATVSAVANEAVTYRWVGPGGFTSTAQSFTASVAGTYSVTVTSANGCTATASTTLGQNITPPAGVVASNNGPLNCAQPTATVSVTSTTLGVTYSWSGPGGFTSTAQTFTTSVAGVYSVTATNPVNGCTTVTSTNVVQNNTPVANVAVSNTGPLTCTLTTVTVSASSSTPGVTYAWTGPGGFTSTAQSFTTSTPGTYSVTVSGPNGCSPVTVSTTVGQNITPPANVSATNTGPLSCTLGSVTVSASSTTPGVTYAWSGPGGFTSSAQSFITASAGVFSVTVTSANGCTATASTTVGQDNTGIQNVTISNTGPLNCTQTSATVSVNTTTASVTYSWVGPGGFTSTAQSFTTSVAGTYSVTLTSTVNGCTAVAATTVEQNIAPPAAVVASNTGPLTCTLTTATVSVTTTTPGVTYSWVGPGGFTSTAQSFTTSTPGLYSVTLTAPNGCTATASTTVSQNITPPAGVTATNTGPLSCTLLNATVSASSTTPGVIYVWAGPGGFVSTSQNFVTSVPGAYTVTVTNPANGCSTTAVTTVGQDITPPANVTATNNGPLSCTLTAVTVSASSTTGGVTYRWAGPGGFTSTAQSFTTSVAGVYSVTVTSANGCVATANTTVGQDVAPPTVIASNTGPLTCALTTRTVSATANEAVTYAWSGPGGFTSTSASFTTSVAGTYSVTVTSANGCTATASTTLQQDVAPPTVIASNTGPLTCALTTRTVSATANEAVTYAWSGPGGFTSTAASFTTSVAGTYSVTVTSANGCTATASTTLQQDVTTPTVAASNNGPITCAQTTAAVSATASEAVTYAWSGPGGFTSTAQSFTTSTPGTYTVVVTAANGCTAATSTTIFNNTATPDVTATVSNTITINQPTATLTASSTTPGVTYQWNTGETTATISVSAAGTYSVTVTAPNGCTAATTTTVVSDTAAPSVTASVSNTLTCAQPTATISTTATPGVTYRWNTGATAASIVVSEAGTYSVTVTAPNGATAATTTTVVSDTTAPSVTASVSNTLTCAQPTATISTTASPGVTYQWSTGETTATISVSAAGAYTVTVTAPNGCTAATTTTVVSDTATPDVTIAASNTLTCAQPTATLTASSTTPGVTYQWNTGETMATISVSAAGTYSVTVTAPNGCTAATTTTVVSDTAAPSVTASVSNTLTCAQPTATISTTATPGVTYRWNTGEVAPSILVGSAGVYSVTVTSANGCTATATTTVVSDTAAPTLTVGVSNTLTCAQPTATISTTASPGSTYLWSTGANTPSILVSVAGTYSVTATTPNGCVATAIGVVEQNFLPPTNVTSSNTGPLTCTLTTVTVSASSSAPGITYSWSGPGGFTANTQSFTTSVAGTYSVTLTGINGCTAVTSTTVQQDVVAPNVTATNSGPLTCTLTTAAVSATANEAVTYAWSGPGGITSTAQSFTTSTPGTYTVVVTAANGCTATTTTTIQINQAAPTVTATNSGPLTCTLTTAAVSATANEAVTYAWSGPGGITSTAQSFTTSTPGTYTVVVTSANGCTATTTTTIQIDQAAPTVTATNTGPLTCTLTTVSVSASASEAVTYAWSGPGGITSTAQSFTTSTPGTYTVVVTSANGCTATTTTIITSNTIAPALVATGGVISCEGTSLQITASATPTNVTYAWSGPGGYTSTEQNPTVTAIGTYTLTVTSANGCTATDTAIVSKQPCASLGDLVFEDTNANGQQDAGEPGIAGVTVTLLQNNLVVNTTTTNASGVYSFTGLTPGLPYVVQFGAPTGYTATVANVGPDATDSDADPNTGQTISYILAAGENNLTVDAGFYRPASLGDRVFADANRNGIQDGGETGIPGVTVTLVNNGTAVASVVTDANGVYSFTGLTPGVSYQVQFTAPANFTASPANQGGDDATDSDAINGVTQSVTLASGENNTTLDAGFYLLPASLGDLVFEDINANGVQDAGEPGIAGVTVNLLQNGTVVATTTTNASGVYSFTGLLPNVAYVVSFTAPAGFTATLADQGGDDAADSDVNPLTGQTGSYTLAAGESNSTVDAGFYRPASLGDRVFADANRNGIQDGGETGIPGVTVSLLRDNTVVAIITTDANGVYSFTGLTPGVSYQVRFTTPAGYTATLGNQGGDDATDSDAINGVTQSVTLASGENNTTLDAGFYLLPASLGNFAFEDINVNGIQDPGEPGVPGVTVSLLQNGVVVQVTSTNANGEYSFTNLLPGVAYQVQFAPMPMFTITADNEGGDDALDSDANPLDGETGVYILESGENNTTVDVGLYRQAALGDRVFADVNRNGVQDAGEPGIAGVTVTLISNGLSLTTTTTDSSGVYSFTALTPGVPYSVSFTAPANYTATLANQGGDDAADSDPINGVTQSITLASGETNNTLDAGFYLLRFDLALSKDIVSAPSPLLPGGVITYQIIVTNQGELTATNTEVTDFIPDGTAFNAAASPGFTQSGSNAVATIASLAPGESATLTIGLTLTATTGGIITNRAEITADSGDDVDSTPGNAGTVPNEDDTDTALLQPQQFAALGDFVFEDLNANGQQDAGEPGIAGVTVQLLQNGVVVNTTTTNASGVYSFTGLTPGLPYQVQFTAPAGYTATLANQGGNGATDSDADPLTGRTATFTLASGEVDLSVDAGFYRPASLGNLVFNDLNQNGQQDAGETGIPNVTVQLLNTNGNVLLTTTTDANGVYSFTSLTPGIIYVVAFTQPDAFTSTTANTGNDATDSDANEVTGRTGPYVLASGENNTTVDAGFYCITPVIAASAPPVCSGETLVLTGTTSSTGVSYAWTGPNSFTASGAVVTIPNAMTANSGSYTLTVTNLITGCSSSIGVDAVVNPAPESVTLAAREATCDGSTSRSDGQVVLGNFGPNDRFDVSTGTTYNGATSYNDALPIPANGVILSNISRTGTPQTYIVRVFTQAGCFIQRSVVLQNTQCECPPAKCVPFVIQKIKSRTAGR
ncbi:SdrD B-like domain-containing protein [Fibrisoma limi]|uniref:SdrD B-like domain-containing protein n=1 Tax=Fibrisoma limi TaxID=663275 RepID=UPI00030B31C3|nr:SdrD B-like domain-containing protein [Fibrisoma limi]